jgi:hypothetical protein
VVHAGQMVVQLARQGGRDAVFDVPERLIRTGPRDSLVQLALTNDPSVKATGRVREVAPRAHDIAIWSQASRQSRSIRGSPQHECSLWNPMWFTGGMHERTPRPPNF